MMAAVLGGWTRWRRARNLRVGIRAAPRGSIGLRLQAPSPSAWLLAACLLLAALGAAVIVVHARWLAAAGNIVQADARLAALQPLMPGATFSVPVTAGVRLEQHGASRLLILSGLGAEPVRRIDLCSQMLDPARPGRLLALRAGWRFEDVAALVERNRMAASPAALRNIVLAEAPMPRIELSGWAAPDFLRPGARTLELRWEGYQAQWIGDAGAAPAAARGQAALRSSGWLLWGDNALRVARRPTQACPTAGELALQLYRPGPAGGAALLAAFPATGNPVELRVPAGDWRVPDAAPAAREDQQLFERLSARGLVRLGADGLAELAPADLVAWRAAGATAWDAVAADAETRRLLERLHRRADGAFVREQVRIFNGERRLLAWRVRPGRRTAMALAGGRPARWRRGHDEADAWARRACSRACRRAGRRGSASPTGPSYGAGARAAPELDAAGARRRASN
jgi:hypothetical protein